MGNALTKIIKTIGGIRFVSTCVCCGRLLFTEGGKQYCKNCETGYVDTDKVINEMLEKFGEDSQIDVAIEEMSELTKELIKYKRSKLHFREKQATSRKNVVEEISDVLFMFEYLKMIFGISDKEIENQILEKAKRTRERYIEDASRD